MKMLAANPHHRLSITEVLEHPWIRDRDKLQRTHLAETVEELKRYNARRKLKGAVQAIAGGTNMDPLYASDADSKSITISLYIYPINNYFPICSAHCGRPG